MWSWSGIGKRFVLFVGTLLFLSGQLKVYVKPSVGLTTNYLYLCCTYDVPFEFQIFASNTYHLLNFQGLKYLYFKAESIHEVLQLLTRIV